MLKKFVFVFSHFVWYIYFKAACTYIYFTVFYIISVYLYGNACKRNYTEKEVMYRHCRTSIENGSCFDKVNYEIT